MPLNKSTGNMYDWVTHTWNPIRGKCHHDCSYCSIKDIAKRYDREQEPLHLVESELKIDLGEGNFIFVGSSTDMFAGAVPTEWIRKVLEHCRAYDKNTYLFQTKNPGGFVQFSGDKYPTNSIFGTTIETNREDNLQKAPPRKNRAGWMVGMPRRMVTIEPIMAFDLVPFVEMIKSIRPEWVNIGADSKGHNLAEPSRAEVDLLIAELKKFTEIKKKHNLERLR